MPNVLEIIENLIEEGYSEEHAEKVAALSNKFHIVDKMTTVI